MGSNSKTDVAAAAEATPRVGTRLLLATTNYPNFFNFFFFNLPNSKKNNCRDGRVQDQAELPRGLRGLVQQADQHGILCLVRLSFHEFLLQPGPPSPPRWNGEPHLKPWRPLLSWKRQSTRACLTFTRLPETRATDTSATSLSPSTWASRWRASRPSGT